MLCAQEAELQGPLKGGRPPQATEQLKGGFWLQAQLSLNSCSPAPAPDAGAWLLQP